MLTRYYSGLLVVPLVVSVSYLALHRATCYGEPLGNQDPPAMASIKRHERWELAVFHAASQPFAAARSTNRFSDPLSVLVPEKRGQRVQESAESQALRELEDQFHQAFLAADTKALDALLTADFVWMHGDGAVWTKGRLIDEFRSGKLRYKQDRIDSVKITVYGATAVVVGHDVRQYGTGDAFDFNYTTTYAKQNGEWQVAVFHTSHCGCEGQQRPPTTLSGCVHWHSWS